MPDALLFTQPAVADAAKARARARALAFRSEFFAERNAERRHELVADAILRFVVSRYTAKPVSRRYRLFIE